VRLRKTKAAAVMLAAMGISFSMANSASAADISLGAYEGGGYGLWNQDPGPPPNRDENAPGDSFQACDTRSDGYGILVRLDIDRDGDFDSSTTTKGHLAPYCTDWRTVNLPEGTRIRLYVYKSNDSGNYHPVYQDSTA
jgi:hypothetical protein